MHGQCAAHAPTQPLLDLVVLHQHPPSVGTRWPGAHLHASSRETSSSRRMPPVFLSRSTSRIVSE